VVTHPADGWGGVTDSAPRHGIVFLHALAPKGELPIRTSVRIAQRNDQASFTSTVAAGARLWINWVQ